ncbi:MAG: WD40 repeat domain-containing protein [Candidatus Obscuribacterales bacterium]|jgi:WD40 repeat protein
MTPQKLPCRPRLLRLATSVLISLLALSSSLVAAASDNCPTGRVVPPEEWTFIPSWSPDGKYVLVTWPAPPKVGPDGKLSRVIGKLNKDATGVFRSAPTILTPGQQPPSAMLTNLGTQEPLLLDAKTYKKLPVEFADTPNVFATKMKGGLWSPDSKLIVDHSIFGSPAIFDAQTGKIIMQLKQSQSNIRQKSTWSPDSKRIAINGTENGISIYSIGGRDAGLPLPNIKGECSSLAWSSDGQFIAFFENNEKNCSLVICSPDGKDIRLKLPLKTEGRDLAWSPDGKVLAYSDSAIHILDAELKEIKKLDSDDESDKGLAWSPNGKFLAYRANCPLLKVFDVEHMRPLSELSCEKNGRYHFYWSPDSKYLAITGAANEIVLSDAQSGKILGSKSFDEASVIQWVPDGKAIAISRFNDESVLLEPVNLEPDTVAFTGGNTNNPWQDQRVLKNLDDCFVELEKLMGEGELKKFKSLEGKEASGYGWPFFQMGLRNTWGLNGKNVLVKYFNQMGIQDSRHMSAMIMVMYWRKLNGQPLETEKMAQQLKEAEDQIRPYNESSIPKK